MQSHTERFICGEYLLRYAALIPAVYMVNIIIHNYSINSLARGTPVFHASALCIAYSILAGENTHLPRIHTTVYTISPGGTPTFCASAQPHCAVAAGLREPPK